MREVRSRARERLRWFAGPVMLVLALLIAPGAATGPAQDPEQGVTCVTSM